MRIGIDARMYGPKQGGLGRYIQQLILHLEKLNPDADFVIFLREKNWSDYNPSNPRFTKVLADIPWYGLREQFELPKIIRETKVDLMHFPHWNVPLFYGKPFVVTIHDLLLLHYPTRHASTLGPILYSIKKFFFKLVLRHAAKRSKNIITVSNFSKSDIVKTLHVPEKKITVTYLAPSTKCHSRENGNPQSNCHPDDAGRIPGSPTLANVPEILHFVQNDSVDSRSRSGMTIIKENFKIGRPYALYVGVAYPHKNLDRLLEAWKIFSEKVGNKYQLVLVGKKKYFYDCLLEKHDELFALGLVIFTDFVDDQTLDNLYRSASLYVFPSLYEGFGIPPLEAMRHGVPVVASSAASLPEILEGGALYFNPEQPTELVEALISGFNDRKLREELTDLGRKIIAKYDWSSTAKKTSEVYRNSV